MERRPGQPAATSPNNRHHAHPPDFTPDLTVGARRAEVARVFLRLGVTAFGGPAAHIAAMEEELVRRRQWVTSGEFLDLLSAANLVPGPNSTELAMHLGWRRAGWWGLLAAGCAFIVPASLLVWVIAIAYVHYGARPDVLAFMRGMQPVVLAVVVHAVWRLSRTLLRSPAAILIAALSVVALLVGVNELLVLAGAAVTGLVQRAWSSRPGVAGAMAWAPLVRSTTSPRIIAAVGLAATPAALATTPTLMGVFGAFLKIGSVLFGSGYVLLAFMRAEFVVRLGWLTEPQLLDAIAVGQLTPGPVFSAATFAGYVMAGHGGAMAATAGIFLPAFVFVAVSGPLVRAIRRSPTLGAMLDGVNAASLALMIGVALVMLQTVATSSVSLGIFAVATGLLVGTPIGAGTVLLGGAAVGVLRWALPASL